MGDGVLKEDEQKSFAKTERLVMQARNIGTEILQGFRDGNITSF